MARDEHRIAREWSETCQQNNQRMTREKPVMNVQRNYGQGMVGEWP